MLPISKTRCLAGWTSTSSYNDAKDNETEDRQDLDRGQPKFYLPKESDAKIVDGDNRDEKNCDEDARVDSFGRAPVLDRERRGC